MSRQRILRALDEGDATIAELADRLDMSMKRVVDLLRGMGGEAHCCAGLLSSGTYRRGPAPDGLTGVGRQTLSYTDAAILATIRHDGKTLSEICEEIDRASTHVRRRLFAMRDKVERIDRLRYRAKDWTPAPPRPERVPLPLWAQSLCV